MLVLSLLMLAFFLKKRTFFEAWFSFSSITCGESEFEFCYLILSFNGTNVFKIVIIALIIIVVFVIDLLTLIIPIAKKKKLLFMSPFFFSKF